MCCRTDRWRWVLGGCGVGCRLRRGRVRRSRCGTVVSDGRAADGVHVPECRSGEGRPLILLGELRLLGGGEVETAGVRGAGSGAAGSTVGTDSPATA